LNLRFRCRIPDNTSENLPLNWWSSKDDRSGIENAFVNKCQIFKVDLLDTFLDFEERVVKEVGMRVTENP